MSSVLLFPSLLFTDKCLLEQICHFKQENAGLTSYADGPSEICARCTLVSSLRRRSLIIPQLAATYRMDTQMVDQEPHRRYTCVDPLPFPYADHLPFSVQIIRRIDTRIPSPLLSATVSSLPSGSTSLGKLADMRAPPVLRPAPSRSPAPGSTTTGGSWTSVVARSRAATPSSSRLPDQKAPEMIQRIPPATVPLPSAVGLQPPLAGEEVPDNWEDAS